MSFTWAANRNDKDKKKEKTKKYIQNGWKNLRKKLGESFIAEAYVSPNLFNFE